MSEIMAGTARVDITPAYPISQGGFGQRVTDSLGTHDPLFGKALYLSDGEEQLLILTTDLLAVPGTITKKVLAGITSQVNVLERQICLCASHTHSGPAVRSWDPTDLGTIGQYTQTLVAGLVQAGVQAVQNAAPSRLRTAVGKVDFLVNRRTRGNPNIVDDRMYALSVEEPKTGTSKAVLFGCGCHPVCVGYENYLISADYPGYAQRLIEAQAPTVNALFFNMAQGNMIPSTRKPTNSMDPRGYNGADFGAAEEIGSRLAATVVAALREAPLADGLRLLSGRGTPQVEQNHHDLAPEEALEKAVEREKIIAEYLGEDYFADVTPENLSPLKGLWADACKKVIAEDMDEENMARLLSSICHYRVYLMRATNPAPAPIEVPVQVMGINDAYFVALPGEVLIEVTAEWRRRLDSDKAYVMALANDTFGYLPHASNFEEPGAEDKYETIMNLLEPAAMDLALDEACRLLTAAGGPC